MRSRFNILSIGTIIILALLFVWMLSREIPLNMDEIMGYHALACWYYPLNKLNTFNLPCGTLDLAPNPRLTFGFSKYLPLRSYSYVGSVQSLFYFPLFFFWRSIHSARFFGVVMLAVQAWILARLFLRNWTGCFLMLLAFMPYAIQHAVDVGQLSLQTTTVFLLYYLCVRWRQSLLRSGHGGQWYPTICGLLLSLGLYVRLSYSFLIPGILIMIGSIFTPFAREIWRKNKPFRLCLHFLLFSGAWLLPSYILLTAIDQNGSPYLNVALNDAPYGAYWRSLAVWQHFRTTLLPYLYHPLLSAHAIYWPSGSPILREQIISVAVPLLFLICLIGRSNIFANKSRGVLFFLLGLLTLTVVSMSPRSWAMHHVVLSFPFFILSLFSSFGKKPRQFMRRIILVVALVGYSSLYLEFPKLAINTSVGPCCLTSYDRLNSYINDSYGDAHIIAVIDWGMYLIKALYGPRDQMVLWISADGKVLEAVKQISLKYHRKVVFLGARLPVERWNTMKEVFPTIEQKPPPFDIGHWTVFVEE